MPRAKKTLESNENNPSGTNKPLTVIKYQRFKEIEENIRLCQRMTEQLGEPRCMVLEGESGIGKTTLIKSYAKQFPFTQNTGGITKPVFFTQAPAKITVRSFTESMLLQLGDPAAALPFAARGAQSKLDDRLDHLVIECGVKLVIVDDFQHLLNIDTENQIRAVSDWLKVRIKNTGITYLIVGISGKVTKVLDYNQQLSRLFALRTTLEPFRFSDMPIENWAQQDEEYFSEFDYFVHGIEHNLVVNLDPPEERIALLKALHKATGGIAANVVNLLHFTRESTSQTAIGYAALGEAYERTMKFHIKLDMNPFSKAARQIK